MSTTQPTVPTQRTPPQETVAPPALCRCGHETDTHEHFRSGTDCGVCGPVLCGRYRPRTGRRAVALHRGRRATIATPTAPRHLPHRAAVGARSR